MTFLKNNCPTCMEMSQCPVTQFSETKVIFSSSNFPFSSKKQQSVPWISAISERTVLPSQIASWSALGQCFDSLQYLQNISTRSDLLTKLGWQRQPSELAILCKVCTKKNFAPDLLNFERLSSPTWQFVCLQYFVEFL